MLFQSWFCLPFVLLFSLQTHAQTMVPEFSASVTSGCAPLSVTFRDLTTGNPRFWNWDFGNGTLSNVQFPSITYSQPGTYTVTLVVRNPDGTNGITKTNYITVFPSPQAGFTSNLTTGCAPVDIQFTDQSTSTSGSIASWQWDFGDGGTSTAKNPSHTYTNNGFYNVSLTVTSTSGCRGNYAINRYIRIVSGVKAEFDNSKPVSCQAPYAVNFTNQSSGPGNMTFQWDLGNGVNSTQSNPSTTYASTGTYNVTLTATSEFGCSGAITKPVTLDGPTTSISAPDTVCQNAPAAFVNNGSIAPQKTLWNFGNGQTSTSTNGSVTYATPGSYTVKLINTYTSCKDSATKVVYVRTGPTVDFTATNTIACKPPLNVSFHDNSPGPLSSWSWDFGDGATGTGSNPTHTYNAAGNYTISVTFTDSKGCEGKLVKPAVIQIVPPTAKILNLPDGGCIPFTYTPTAAVTSVDGIATYSWDFGDGTVITGTSPTPPAHTYTTSGVWTIKLTVTTNGGCTTTTIETGGVKTGTPPATNFSMSGTDVCSSDTMHFTDLTPQPVDAWKWDFGDGGSSDEKDPQHVFADTGTFTITLTAFNNFCPSTFTGGQKIHIKPPIASFTHLVNCGNLAVPFTDKSKTDPTYGAISYLWQFGDPANSTSNQQNPTFNYPGYNVYLVKLTVTNGSCTSVWTDTVKLVKELANFTVPSPVCKNANFTITSTNAPQFITKYEWSIDGAPYTTGSQNYVTNIAAPGVHSIALRITDVNGCVDEKTNGSVTVTGPVANFTAAQPGGCKNAIVSFNDHSTIGAAALTKWTFDFGDGRSQAFTSAPFTHTYPDTGAFVPQLTVEDAMGCVDTYKLPDSIFISTIETWFNSDLTKVCPKSDIHFADSSTGTGLTYLWDFGNGGGTSTAQNPVYSYGGNNATYSVKLVITDRGGCKDSVTRDNYITTIKPVPAFDIEDTLTICPPIETKFTFRGAEYDSLEWDFGDGATSTLMNPTHFYNAYGDYTPKLYLWGYGGCKDSASAAVHVLNPATVSSLTYSPVDACNELTVNFSLVTIPDIKYSMIFGDGTSDTTMATSYTHFYGSPAFYQPSIQYTDKQGCIGGVGGGPQIKVIGADPFFGVDRKKFCDSGVVYFTNYTIGNDPVVTRTWNFGDGATSSDSDPNHQYQQPGTYTVSQSVTTQQGCSKTISDTIRVYRTPDPIIAGDSIGCLNATLNLQGTLAIPDTAISWKWSLGNNNTLTTQNISLSFKDTGNYVVYLQATNQIGCTDSTKRNLYVPPIPEITITSDPVIPVTTGITLPVTYSPAVISYNWTPVKNLSCTDCATPFANPKMTTTYNVKVTDQYGCKNNKDITVTVVCNANNYFVPNTFSPNGDGMNDIFAPRGIGLARVNSMRIFNRWGQMVFEKMNFMANDRTPTGGWDGTYKGKPAPADVYVYIIEFVCENNAIIPVKGNVALVR